MSVLLLIGVVACGDEDVLTPEIDTITDCFAPDPNATDEESCSAALPSGISFVK